MTNVPLTASDLENLRKYDTPTVCNVIELFNIRPRNTGYMDARIRACFPELRPMVGYASTATFRSAAPARGNAYTSLDEQVAAFADVPGAPIVVFQDLDDPVAAATFGEIMCSTYQAFGSVGLITSGAGRDLDQVHALGFPVFTNGTMCAHGYCHTPSIGVPVHVGGVIVHTGDLLHGDCNGITTIPVDIAAQVADACAEFMEAEAVILNYLRAGNVTPAGLREARAESHQMIGKIQQRVTSKSLT